MNMFVGTAAMVGAPALPQQASAATIAGVLDPNQISQELRDLVSKANELDDVLREKQAVFDAVHVQYEVWAKNNPEPRISSARNSHRRYNKWHRRYDKYLTEIRYCEAQDAQIAAVMAHREARKAIATYKARDLNEIMHKAAAGVVFESGIRGKLDGRANFISQGVTVDLVSMMAELQQRSA